MTAPTPSGLEDPLFYTDEFHTTLENALNLLIADPKTRQYVIDPAVAQRFSGDFYGLLSYHGVDQKLHYITTRMSGYTSRFDFQADGSRQQVFVLPDIGVIQQYFSRWSSSLGARCCIVTGKQIGRAHV